MLEGGSNPTVPAGACECCRFSVCTAKPRGNMENMPKARNRAETHLSGWMSQASAWRIYLECLSSIALWHLSFSLSWGQWLRKRHGLTWNFKDSWSLRNWVKTGSCWRRDLWIIAPHKDRRCQFLACTWRAAVTWPDSSWQLGIAEDGDYEEEAVTVWARGQKTQTQWKLCLISSATPKPI